MIRRRPLRASEIADKVLCTNVVVATQVFALLEFIKLYIFKVAFGTIRILEVQNVGITYNAGIQ